MTLEQQVTSLELSKKLKELGMKQESLFYWWGWFPERPYPQPEGFGENYETEQAHKDQEWKVSLKENVYDLETRSWKGMYTCTLTEVSAFTVAELGELLPQKYFTRITRE